MKNVPDAGRRLLEMRQSSRAAFPGTPLVARTVLDLRSSNEKFVSQTMLLAASWHRHGAKDAGLEVLVVGGENQVLTGFFDEIGARHSCIAPGDNDDFSKSSNKIEAAHADPQGRRVLLLDNDVCFFGGIAEMNGLRATAIAASEAGSARVSDAQWKLIEDELKIPLLRRRFAPINVRWLVAPDPHATDAEDCERYLYVNSGVILFPFGHDHRALWKIHQRRVYECFRDHPLSNDAVTKSDQAGLAVSIAAHGEFAWLPLRFNYRHGCFARGMETPNRIAIVHFTGNVDGDAGLGVTARMTAYWQQYILSKVKRLPPSVPDAEKRRREETARLVLASAHDMIREYDLENRLHAYRRGQGRRARFAAEGPMTGIPDGPSNRQPR